jgi:hypothetical protein
MKYTYAKYYFCGNEGIYIEENKAVRSESGGPRCPYCHLMLRTSPRKVPKKRRVSAEELPSLPESF